MEDCSGTVLNYNTCTDLAERQLIKANWMCTNLMMRGVDGVINSSLDACEAECVAAECGFFQWKSNEDGSESFC